MMVLEDETDLLIAIASQVGYRAGKRVCAQQPYGPGGWPLERSEDVQERALARSRRTCDGKGLAPPHPQVGPGKHDQPPRLAHKLLAQVGHGQVAVRLLRFARACRHVKVRGRMGTREH